MKKTLLLITAMILIFAGCKKDDVIEASKVEVNEHKIERGWDYVKISAEYVYPIELEAVTLYLSENEDMSGAKTYKCDIEGKTFSVEVYGLKDGTKYYYQFEYDNGYEKEKSVKENVATYAKPVVVTNDVTNKTTTSATLNGRVTNSDTENKITERGFCWGTEPGLTIEGTYTTDGAGTGSYSSNLTNLTPNTTYYVRAYATNSAGTGYGDEISFTTLEEENGGIINGHEYVDLGLPSGLKWATCNVGASSPEDYGDYFAWGETTTKSAYTEDNSLTYGLTISELQSQGIIDGSGNLTPSHDAATANWGGTWRLPTKAELEELLDECTWIWTTQNGVNGYKVTGPNGNQIFLPAAGYRFGSSLISAGEYGNYWSSSPDESYSSNAYNLLFNGGDHNVEWYYRDDGQSVRPVAE